MAFDLKVSARQWPVPRFCESRLQRSPALFWPSPRAVAFAGMTDAVGVDTVGQGPSSVHAYARHVYFRSLRARIGLWIFTPSHPLRLPRMWFLFVRPAFCLQLPSDSASRPTPLLFG